MNILVINCHWDNRGDEAAIRSMIYELCDRYPDATVYVQRAIGKFAHFPESERVKVLPSEFPIANKKRFISEALAAVSGGRLCFGTDAKKFYQALKTSTIVLHAPGGPSIGDIYLKQERRKLLRLIAVRRAGVPYAFYAPSMGPFKNKLRNPLRKYVLKGARLLCLREAKSARLVQEFIPGIKTEVTLDSAFQHVFDTGEYEKELSEDKELSAFVGEGQDVIGVTVTDLQWNSLYRDDGVTEEKIRSTFTEVIEHIRKLGYRVLFIPQLFDDANDADYMATFARDGCFVMGTDHDCFFQQYVIGKVHAVVGMRYHSNIFSAKMGTPFVSVSYEQKMRGFMDRAGLSDWCIDIADLSPKRVIDGLDALLEDYDNARALLEHKRGVFIAKSRRTTELVGDVIDKILAS